MLEVKLLSVDVLYFSVYGDFSLKVNIAPTITKTQHFTDIDCKRPYSHEDKDVTFSKWTFHQLTVL